MRLMFNFPDADSAEAAELQFASERRQQIRAMVKAGFPEAPEGEASRPLRNGDTVAMTVAGVRHEAVVYFNRDFMQVSLTAPLCGVHGIQARPLPESCGRIRDP